MARRSASNRSGETRFKCGNEPVLILCSGVRKSALIVSACLETLVRRPALLIDGHGHDHGSKTICCIQSKEESRTRMVEMEIKNKPY